MDKPGKTQCVSPTLPTGRRLPTSFTAPPQQHGMNLIPGKAKPSAGLPALAYSPRKLSKQPEPSQTAEDDRRDAGLARTAVGNTSGTDQLDITVDPGACRQEPDCPDGGGRS